MKMLPILFHNVRIIKKPFANFDELKTHAMRNATVGTKVSLKKYKKTQHWRQINTENELTLWITQYYFWKSN